MNRIRRILFLTSSLRNSTIYLAMLTALISAQSFAEARDPSMCAKVLQPDTVSFTRDSRLHLAYLDTISQEKYDTSKADGSLDAVIPVYGLPVKIGASYGEFKTSLDDYKRSVNYQLDKSESILYYTSHLPTNNVTGFVECMRSQSRGLFLTPAGQPDEHGNIVLVVEWNPPGGVNKGIKLNFPPILNGKIVGPTPTSLAVNSTKNFTVSRTDEKGSVSVTVNGTLPGGGGYSDQYYDPAAPLPLPNYHFVSSDWHSMTSTWSTPLPNTTPAEECVEVTSEGTWSCHQDTCPKSCDADVGNRSVRRNVESSGAFDAPGQYGDNTGRCRYTFICTTRPIAQ